MTVHVDKVKPFVGEVPKSWLAGEPSSEVRELPERADDQETLVKAPYDEPDDELNVKPDCLPILLSISVFSLYSSCSPLLVFRAVD